jgi:hypothetical protein
VGVDKLHDDDAENVVISDGVGNQRPAMGMKYGKMTSWSEAKMADCIRSLFLVATSLFPVA